MTAQMANLLVADVKDRRRDGQSALPVTSAFLDRTGPYDFTDAAALTRSNGGQWKEPTVHVRRTDKMLAAEDSSYVGDYEFVYGDTHCISNWLRHTDRGYRVDTVSHGCTWSWVRRRTPALRPLCFSLSVVPRPRACALTP